jgi:hypothetical protein
MLWTDSIWITQDDLMRIDSEVVNVAAAEGVSLNGDNGLIRGAIEEASNELQKLIIAFGGYLNSGDLTANHLAAVLNVGIGNSIRQKALLTQVCVSGFTPTSWNHIKQWAVHWTLRVFYRNVFSRTVNDRYEKKMNFFKDELVRRVTPTLFGLGIPIVLQPLLAPASYFTRNSGTWDSSNVSLVAGAGTLDNTNFCDVVITFVDQSQPNFYVSASTPNNCESDAPTRITQQMGTGNVLQVSIASLNPPTGGQDPATILVAVVAQLKATGWNIYVSSTPGGILYLQNSTPVPIATQTYTFSGDPVFSGFPIQQGQYESRRLSLVPMRQRA